MLTQWQAFSKAAVRAFHAYARWLVGISWKRFVLLSLLLLICMGIAQNLPPFRWRFTEEVSQTVPGNGVSPPIPPIPSGNPGDKSSGSGDSLNISIGEHGVVIHKSPSAPGTSPTERAASAPAQSASEAQIRIIVGGKDIRVDLPAGVDKDAVREAVDEAVDQLRELADAQREAEAAAAAQPHPEKVTTVRTVHYGEFLFDLAWLWIIGSAILKITYKGTIQAQVKAAQAAETAEAESLKRQVVEARMATMQAQVEPHFLFNTLASIDHLIETDPPRASLMQKNLIALLRASMPTLRDATDLSGRDLGRELALVRPYLEILKVRMEERLDARLEVPEGLMSAEFPSMMVQTLVENAIRHGLEPKAAGGRLTVRAEIVHGDLAVSVVDSGVGFGVAETHGTGVGLSNIRERLALLYGDAASLKVAAEQPSGTRVTITVPYRAVAPSRRSGSQA